MLTSGGGVGYRCGMTTSGYEGYEAAGELLRALAAPIRVAIVTELATGERCVHELVEQLRAPQPLVSQHLRVLRGAGVVRGSRRGREIAYSLVDEHVAHIVADAVSHAGEGRPAPAAARPAPAPPSGHRGVA
jgi:DNA-binding transcriptional ArsR family regulator